MKFLERVLGEDAIYLARHYFYYLPVHRHYKPRTSVDKSS